MYFLETSFIVEGYQVVPLGALSGPKGKTGLVMTKLRAKSCLMLLTVSNSNLAVFGAQFQACNFGWS